MAVVSQSRRPQCLPRSDRRSGPKCSRLLRGRQSVRDADIEAARRPLEVIGEDVFGRRVHPDIQWINGKTPRPVDFDYKLAGFLAHL